MTDAAKTRAHSGLAPVFGAAGGAMFALVLSVSVLMWRGGAQREVLDAQTTRCKKDDSLACDALRNQCLKRNGEACEALAESMLASPSKHDVRDAMNLLSEACELRNRRACVRAARKLNDGDGVTKDVVEAGRLFRRGCELGIREACAPKETVPTPAPS